MRVHAFSPAKLFSRHALLALSSVGVALLALLTAQDRIQSDRQAADDHPRRIAAVADLESRIDRDLTVTPIQHPVPGSFPAGSSNETSPG